MPWSNLSTNYTNSPVGLLDFANSSTGSLFGASMVLIIYVVVFMANSSRPKTAFAIAGFFAMITAFMLSWILTSFSVIYIYLATASFLVGLLPLGLSRDN